MYRDVSVHISYSAKNESTPYAVFWFFAYSYFKVMFLFYQYHFHVNFSGLLSSLCISICMKL